MNASTATPGMALPFDWKKLDGLMEEGDLDVLLVSSKHNIQYLLGGYRFFFFDTMDAVGVSRYLPILVYPRGRPDRAAYIGNTMEAYEQELGRFWPPTVVTRTWGTQDAMREAIQWLGKLDPAPRRIGVESAFLPVDAYQLLEAGFEGATMVDAQRPLERLRALKTPAELDQLRSASESIVGAMLAVIAGHGPGTTKNELVAAMRREVHARGLAFDYCLVTAGTSFNRAPSDQRWGAEEIASLDSGGNLNGYIGDLCRMAVMGEPDNELTDLLGEVDAIQQIARKAVRPGALGREIIAAGEGLVARSPHRQHLKFVAHGMGIVSHEAPRLTGSGPVPYPGDDADSPLEPGMVISIETTLPDPARGFIKLEDTVAVTATGCEAFGDGGRGWNKAGGARDAASHFAT